MMKNVVLYIIDDDPDDQDLLIDILKEIDPSLECYTAKNGQEGLQKLETHVVPLPSIIFLDLHMPRINGKQVLFELKNDPDLKNIPVVVYSTSSNKKDLDEMLLLGASFYLVKEFDYIKLKQKLRTILSNYSSFLIRKS
ncbi:MAG: response regulator [Nitrososphaeraceae archaeon]